MTASRALALALAVALSAAASADEGLWPFHNPPLKKLKDDYGIELTQAWLDHARLASVRFNSGGSGSFVSPHGLVLTNHHVAADSIHKLSALAHDFTKEGFHARKGEDELKCPDLELNVLVAMTDVTARVKDAVKPDMNPAQATAARRAVNSAIEKEAREKSGLRSNVVTLYRGAEYWLYQYKQYTDVRLVFAPEKAIAYFGGDYDNFTFPRFNLDFALFRAYEDGKPASTPEYFKWNDDGVKEGDVVFVSGHPGSTSRQQTLQQLEYLRDVGRPRTLKILAAYIDALRAYGAQGDEQRRQSEDDLFGISNSQKAQTGDYEGLRDPALMAKKAKSESELRAKVKADPKLAAMVGDAWDAIAKVQEEQKAYDQKRAFTRLRGKLFSSAIGVVRYVAEVAKPNAERLAEFRDSSLDSTRLDLFSPAPVYPGVEETMLRAGLELAVAGLSGDDEFVVKALGGRTPAQAAKALVEGTKLYDPKVRQQLVEGGADAIAKSTDPMIVLARELDPMLRNLRKQQEEAATVVEAAAGKIAQASFAAYGNDVYPDATFTLRLSIGRALPYEEDTTLVPWKTTFYGLFERWSAFGGKPPFNLPERFVGADKKLDLATPFNFVHTCDIIGGNSGSPTLNARGEIVGLIFDGNIQSLPNNFVFANASDRAVSVHCAAITECLRKIYGAQEILDELTGSP